MQRKARHIMSINKVIISGNITKDAEFKAYEKGQLLRFSVAVNDRVKNADDEWVDRPNYVDCVMFGRRAEALQSIIKKGLKVTVEGKLRYSTWEKDGAKHSKLEVAVDELELMQRERKPEPPAEGAQYFG